MPTAFVPPAYLTTGGANGIVSRASCRELLFAPLAR
jgi:hypothetical protein